MEVDSVSTWVSQGFCADRWKAPPILQLLERPSLAKTISNNSRINPPSAGSSVTLPQSLVDCSGAPILRPTLAVPLVVWGQRIVQRLALMLD